MPWICPLCSTNNMDSDTKCIVCDHERVSSGVCTLTFRKVQELGLTGNVVVPSEFNVIGEGAFKGRTDIISVTVHAGVKKIAKEAFSGCTSLSAVHCIDRLDSIGKRAFADCVSLSEDARPVADYIANDAFKMTAPSYTPPPPSDDSESADASETPEIGSGKTWLQKLGAALLSFLKIFGISFAIGFLMGNILYSFTSNYQSGPQAEYSSLVAVLAMILLSFVVYYRFKDEGFKDFAKDTKIIPAVVILILAYVEHIIFDDMLIWLNLFVLLALLFGELIFLGKYIYKRKFRFIFALLSTIIITAAMLYGILTF